MNRLAREYCVSCIHCDKPTCIHRSKDVYAQGAFPVQCFSTWDIDDMISINCPYGYSLKEREEYAEAASSGKASHGCKFWGEDGSDKFCPCAVRKVRVSPFREAEYCGDYEFNRKAYYTARCVLTGNNVMVEMLREKNIVFISDIIYELTPNDFLALERGKHWLKEISKELELYGWRPKKDGSGWEQIPEMNSNVLWLFRENHRAMLEDKRSEH